MDFATVQAELRGIGTTVHAFAAIGAALRLYQAKQQVDPAVEARLLAAVKAVLPGALDGLNEQQIPDAPGVCHPRDRCGDLPPPSDDFRDGQATLAGTVTTTCLIASVTS